MKKILRAIHKLNTPTFNLFNGNCGAFAVGLASALGAKDCQLVWVKDKDIYGVFHCSVYHKPTRMLLDGRGVIYGEEELLNESARFFNPTIYRGEVTAENVRYVLRGTNWTIPPSRFARAIRKAI